MAAGLSGLLLDAVLGAAIAAAALAAVPFAGFLVGRARRYVHVFLASALGPRVAFFIMNYATFPGVIAHEFAHALVAKLSGGRVDELRPFAPSGDSLGYTRFTCIGTRGQRAFQAAAASCAPVACGYVLVSGLRRLAAYYPGEAGVRALLFYLAASVACHMSMSAADLKCYRHGAVGLSVRAAAIGLVAAYIIGRRI